MIDIVLTVIIFGLLILLWNKEKTIKKQKEELKEQKLWHKLALTDSLTQIPNRMAYSNDLKALDKERFILVIFDIDNFKTINDTSGHLTGDRMLKSCAQMLCDVFADKQGKVYRIGGDEFAVILKDTTEKELIDIFMEIRKREKFSEFKVSKGYAIANGKKDVLTVFKHADEMLYADKANKNETEYV